MANLHDVALGYHRQNLAVLPARLRDKRPAVRTWKQYQNRLPTIVEVQAWFANNHEAVCLLCGAVSGHLEMIDFDQGGELYEAWVEKVNAAAPGLLDKLIIERSPCCGIDCFGGRHVIYRCPQGVCGNIKLAQRKETVPDATEVVRHNKRIAPKNVGDHWEIILTLIETRGEGGIYLTQPTPGYQLLQGSYDAIPDITSEEREILLSAAWELTEIVPEEARPPATPPTALPEGSLRPGDDFNRRGTVQPILLKHGWSLAKPGENEYWRRPGKEHGWSATLKQIEGQPVFYCFSSNAAPFEEGRAYGSFSVYALLEHNGDFAAAARTLRIEGYGSREPGDVDLTGILGCGCGAEPPEPQLPDPGPLPAELLRVPGFVGEVMDYCLETAPYPNPVMAFCGALALQAFLAGRRVRDPGDNRTNIYLLGLAHSAAGKDWPRKVNTRIVHEVGLANCLGERFASGEGMQDALFLSPGMLFQTDEIDGMLQSINKAKDARHEAIMSTLLTMYSSANSVFPMRRKAGKESPGAIDQPCLVIFGTAIPNHYYEALSERMLTNGFFARMIILEAGPRGTGQEPRIRDLPTRVLATAKWWADYRPGTGNLQTFHPVPTVIDHSDEARCLLIETREQAEAEYTAAEARGDPVGTTVWGRVSEQTRKLALLYAISENHQSPCIGLAAVRWASSFVMHQTRRMLFMAAGHVAENPFHAECLKFIRKLRESPGGLMARNKLMRTMRCKLADFDQIVGTLLMQGDIVPVEISTKTKTAQGYRLP